MYFRHAAFKSDYYKAPEVWAGQPIHAHPEAQGGAPYDPFAADVWSAGVVLYALCAGAFPFQATTPELMVRAMHTRPLQLPDHVDPECRDLLEGVLRPNPAERLTLQQVKQHPWFLHGLPAAALDLTAAYIGRASPCAKSAAQVEGIIVQCLEVLQPQVLLPRALPHEAAAEAEVAPVPPQKGGGCTIA